MNKVKEVNLATEELENEKFYVIVGCDNGMAFGEWNAYGEFLLCFPEQDHIFIESGDRVFGPIELEGFSLDQIYEKT